MKIRLLAIGALLVISACTTTKTAPPNVVTQYRGCNVGPTSPNDPDAVALRKMTVDEEHAFVNGDTSWFEQNYADDIVIVTGSGGVRTKAAFLARFRAGTYTGGSLENSEPDFVQYVCGDVAVETGVERFRYLDSNKAEHAGSFRYTTVYVRRDGRWMELVDQVTNIP